MSPLGPSSPAATTWRLESPAPALFRPFWLPMQLGNLWIGGAAGLLVALLDHDLGVALGEVHQSTCSRSRLVHRGVA